MNTTTNAVDWVLCLAWSLGHAILTAMVGRTAVNATVTYDAILLYLGTGGRTAHRWVGRCKTCRKGHSVAGSLARGRYRNIDETVVVTGQQCYRTAGHGTDPTVLFISCCDARVKLAHVVDTAKPNRARHECNAKCLASTGPNCQCKCKGANHGASYG